MSIKKLDKPLVLKGRGAYPLTTSDQIIKKDGSRLETENGISVEHAINADTLGGKSESELSVVKAVDCDSLGGILAKDYATKEYVNNPLIDLLFNSTSVSTTDTEYSLSNSWKDYKQISITVKMNYSSTTDIHYFINDYYTFTLKSDYSYAILREVPANTAGEASCWVTFLENGNVKLKKISNAYNGCIEIWIYGIK